MKSGVAQALVVAAATVTGAAGAGRPVSAVARVRESTAGAPPVKPGQMRLEVVVIPVRNVDGARDFYTSLGWRLDADFPLGDGARGGLHRRL